MFQVPVNPEEYKPVDPIQQIMGAYYDVKKMKAIPDQIEQAKQVTAAHLAQMAADAQLSADKSTEAQAHTGLYSAQTGKANAEVANMGQENLFKNLGLQAKFGALQNSSSRFGQFYQLNKFVQTPEGATKLATDKNFARNYMMLAGTAAYEAASPDANKDYSSQMNLLKSMQGGGSSPGGGGRSGGGDFSAPSSGDYAASSGTDYASASGNDYASSSSADYASPSNQDYAPAPNVMNDDDDDDKDNGSGNGNGQSGPGNVANAGNSSQRLQSDVKGLKVSPAQKAALDVQYKPNDSGTMYVDQSGNPIQVNRLSLPQQQAAKDINDAQITAFQNAAADHVQKVNNTTLTLNQRKAVNGFINLMNQGQDYWPGFLRYVGAAKKANVLVSKFESSTAGKNNPDFNDYISFKTTILPGMSNEYRKIMAGQASDAEQNFVKDIVNPDTWWASPASATAKMNSVYRSVQDFAKSSGSSQTETENQLQEFANRQGDFYSVNPQAAAQGVPAPAVPPAPGQMPPGQPASAQPQQVPTGMTVNPAQLQAAPPGTAQQLGMQAAQAAPQQGGAMPQGQPAQPGQQRMLPMPKFHSQAEATAWFAKLDPKYRQALIQQQARLEQMRQQQQQMPRGR